MAEFAGFANLEALAGAESLGLETLCLLLEHLPFGVVLWQADSEDFLDMRYLYRNRAAIRLAKLDLENPIGKTVQELFPDVHDVPEPLNIPMAWQRVATSGVPEVLHEALYHDKVGNPQWFQCHVLPLGGRRVACVFENVTDERLLRAELDARQLELQRLAATDDVTKLPNRRAVFKRLDEETSRAQRYRRPLAVGMVDVDHFKRINDVHGHVVGDRILATVAATLQSALRGTDFCGRVGGEEFLVLMPETSEEQALSALEKVRQRLAATDIVEASARVGITVSIGVTEATEATKDALQLVREADQAMYQAKNHGRNRIEGYRPSDLPDGGATG